MELSPTPLYYPLDQWVRDHLLWGGADGFFVEFGARDGITHSNTAYTLRTLGWKGLCIEPLAVEFKALRVNRPNCRCVNGAIGTRRGLQDFVIVGGVLAGGMGSGKKWHRPGNGTL